MTHQTLGKKIMDVLFKAPTEADFGLPPGKKDLSKKSVIVLINEHWDHPFDYDCEVHQAENKRIHDEHQKAKADKKKDTKPRTLGERLTSFLFDIPTEESMGLSKIAPKNKEEALHKIDVAWDHPFDPNYEFNDAQVKKYIESEKARAARDGDSTKPRRSVGESIKHFVLDAPTEEDFNLPSGSKEFAPEKEKMELITHAYKHPLAPYSS